MTDWPVSDRQPSHDRWIPWTFVAFFLVIFVVNGIMLTFALRSFNGLSTDEAYNRGLGYNQTLAAHQAQYEMGWQIDLSSRDSGSGQSHLTLVMFDAQDLPLAIDGISATARRPISQDLDFDVAFRHAGRGLYEAKVTWPREGQWDLRVVIESGEKSYRLDRRLFVR